MKAKLITLLMAASCTTGSLAAADVQLADLKLSSPSDWAVHREAGEMDLMMTAQMTDKHLFLSNISLTTDHLGAMSLEDYFVVSMKNMEKSVANYRLESSGSTQIGGREAKWALFQATVAGVSGKILQYMIKNGKQVVLMTAVDSLDQFASHRIVFEQVARSIKFDREVITPKRDGTAPLMRDKPMPQKSVPPVSKPQKKIFQSAPGDADMPARLYYDR